MKNIERLKNLEELVYDIEKYLPTSEYIKEQANIDVISIRKYFPKAYRAKTVMINGVCIIFTESKEKYISSSNNLLGQISLYMRNSDIKNILVAYIYEVGYADTKLLESWLEYKLGTELLYDKKSPEGAIPKKIEDLIPKNINIDNIIPKDISIVQCIDNISIEDTGNLRHIPGAYILQFTDGECYVGSSNDLFSRLRTHRYRLCDFISEISICSTQNIVDATILEHIFIKILKPKYNRLPYPDCTRDKNIRINRTNVLSKNRYKKSLHRNFRGKSVQLVELSKDMSELLNKEMTKLYNQGIFSWSLQTLTELAIKEGLNIIHSNISQISEIEEIRRYIEE